MVEDVNTPVLIYSSWRSTEETIRGVDQREGKKNKSDLIFSVIARSGDDELHLVTRYTLNVRRWL